MTKPVMHERRKYNALADAYRFANKNSPDRSSKVGAVLFGITMQKLAVSCNQWPRHLPVTESFHEKPLKYNMIVHAEECVLFEAARSGWATNTSVLVAGWSCCSRCARAIIQAGVGTLVCHQPAMAITPARWVEDVKLGHSMLKQAGVRIECLPDKVGEKTFIDGKWWDV